MGCGVLPTPTGAPARNLEPPTICPAPHPLHPTYQTSPKWFLPSIICLMTLESIHFSPVLAPGPATLSPALAFKVLLASGLTSNI